MLALFASGCSLFDHEVDQERLPSTFGRFSPTLSCDQPNNPGICTIEFTGELTAIDTDTIESGNDQFVFPHYTFADGEQEVAFPFMPASVPRLSLGTQYSVVAAEQQYFSLSGIGRLEVSDSQGLKLFVRNVAELAGRSMPLAPEGWTVSVSSGSSNTINRGCGVVGSPIRVTFGFQNENVQLYQGNSATIGDYTITLLTAEELDYSSMTCLDYALPELGFVIARTS